MRRLLDVCVKNVLCVIMYLIEASRSGGIVGRHYATLGLKSCATTAEVRIVAVYVLINPVQINVAAARLFGKRSFLDIQTGSIIYA